MAFRGAAFQANAAGGATTAVISVQNTISGISVASSAVVTVSTSQVQNPFVVGSQINFSGVSGMAQINGLVGTITAIGGSSGAWTATTSINSSGFSAWTSGGTTALNIQVGDILLLFANAGGTGTATITYPSGFAAVQSLTNINIATGNQTAGVHYKVATLSDTTAASFTITSNVSSWQTGLLRVYSGRSTTSPFTASAQTGPVNSVTNGSSFSVTGLTAAANDDIELVFPWVGTGTGDFLTWTTVPSGFAASGNVNAAGAFSEEFATANYVNNPGGVTGTITGTITDHLGGTQSYGAYVISLAQAPVPVISVVQSVNSQTIVGSEGIAVTLSGVTAGNSIAILGSFYNASTGVLHTQPVCTETTNGLPVTTLENPLGVSAGGTNNINAGLWFIPGYLVGAGTHAIQVSFGAAGFNLTAGSVTAMEISGLPPNGAIDILGPASSNWASGGNLTASSGQPLRNAPSIALAALVQHASTGVSNAAFACSQFTDVNNVSNTTGGLGAEQCYQIYNGAASPSALFSWTDGTTAGVQAVIAVLSSVENLPAPAPWLPAIGPGVSPVPRMQFRGLIPIGSVFNYLVPLTGQSITATAGTLSQGFVGNPMTSSTGILSPSTAVTLNGISIGTTAGTMQAFGTSTTPNTGFVPSPGPGVGPFANTQFQPQPFGYSSGVSVSLTGSAIASSTGVLTGAIGETLTGISITSAAGTVTGVTGGGVALGGQAFGSAAGTFPSPSINVPLTGNAITSSSGVILGGSGFRVQATAIGDYQGVLYGPGEVFDILRAADFSDSTVDYSLGEAGGPMYGWMKQVPASTPLTNPTPQIYDWPSARRTVF
jgi:hypothetical protein